VPAPARPFLLGARITGHVRHRSKYVHAELPWERRFYFRDPAQPTMHSAGNLEQFHHELRGCSLAGVEHHVAGHDFSRWVDDVLQMRNSPRGCGRSRPSRAPAVGRGLRNACAPRSSTQFRSATGCCRAAWSDERLPGHFATGSELAKPDCGAAPLMALRAPFRRMARRLHSPAAGGARRRPPLPKERRSGTEHRVHRRQRGGGAHRAPARRGRSHLPDHAGLANGRVGRRLEREGPAQSVGHRARGDRDAERGGRRGRAGTARCSAARSRPASPRRRACC